MKDSFPGDVLDVLEEQCGVVSRAQVLSSGMTRKQIEGRVRGGRWQRLYPGVYATFSGDPGRAAILWAAVLRVGDDAVSSHYTAAELAGLIGTPSATIHVTVPSGRGVSSIPGVILYLSAGRRRPAIQSGRRPRPG